MLYLSVVDFYSLFITQINFGMTYFLGKNYINLAKIGSLREILLLELFYINNIFIINRFSWNTDKIDIIIDNSSRKNPMG